MNLFELGDFMLHRGDYTKWRIDCDALTDDDILALAYVATKQLPHGFRDVIGIPRGGLRLAEALNLYIEPAPVLPVLLVDDVYTSGRSMREARAALMDERNMPAESVMGLVIFSRRLYVDSWILPLWQLGAW